MLKATKRIGQLLACAMVLEAGCAEHAEYEPAIRAYLADVEAITQDLAALGNLVDGLPLPATFASLAAHAKAVAPVRFLPAGCAAISDPAGSRGDLSLMGFGVQLTQCLDALGPRGQLPQQPLFISEVAPLDGGLYFEVGGMRSPGFSGFGSVHAFVAEAPGGLRLGLALQILDPEGTRSILQTLSVYRDPGDSCMRLEGEYPSALGAGPLRFLGVRACRQTCYTEGRVEFSYSDWQEDGTMLTRTGEISFQPNVAVWRVEGQSGSLPVDCD